MVSTNKLNYQDTPSHIVTKVVYSVSAPGSVWLLEWNILVPVNIDILFQVNRKYIYI